VLSYAPDWCWLLLRQPVGIRVSAGHRSPLRPVRAIATELVSELKDILAWQRGRFLMPRSQAMVPRAIPVGTTFAYENAARLSSREARSIMR
jgi:hypothetical protein